MQLLGTSTSPYVRIVQIQLYLCGLDDRVQVAFVPTRSPRSPVNQLNPTGKVPTLVTDEGIVLSETRLICEYLDSLHQRAPFAPPPPDLTARAFEGLAVGCLDGVAVWIREVRRPPSERSPDILRQERDRAERCLTHLEACREWREPVRQYPAACIAVALWRLALSVPDFAWPERYPQVAHWHSAALASPAFGTTASR